MSDDVSHIYSNARRHVATGLTALIAISPIVPVVAWTVNARASDHDSECVDAVVFTTAGHTEATISRSCPGRIVPIETATRSSLTTIDIRNINP